MRDSGIACERRWVGLCESLATLVRRFCFQLRGGATLRIWVSRQVLMSIREDGTAKIAKHREELEDVAESDLSCSWIAEALLEVAEE